MTSTCGSLGFHDETDETDHIIVISNGGKCGAKEALFSVTKASTIVDILKTRCKGEGEVISQWSNSFRNKKTFLIKSNKSIIIFLKYYFFIAICAEDHRFLLFSQTF